MRKLLAVHEQRGLAQARDVVIGLEATARLGGEYADRVRGALLELLDDVLTRLQPAEPEPEPAGARRFWERADVNRPNAKVG